MQSSYRATPIAAGTGSGSCRRGYRRARRRRAGDLHEFVPNGLPITLWSTLGSPM